MQATHRLRAVDVRFISLAGRPKNGRALILKSDLARGEVVVSGTCRIAKADGSKHMAYGVVYSPESVDADGHVMGAEEIEAAMLAFMSKGRVGEVDVDHDEATGGAFVAESWLVKGTDAGETCDALFPDEAVGAWCVGVKVEDAATWARIESGEISGLSFAGVAILDPVTKGRPLELVAKAEKVLEDGKRYTCEPMPDGGPVVMEGDEPRPTPAPTVPSGPVVMNDEEPRPMPAPTAPSGPVAVEDEEPAPTAPTGGGPVVLEDGPRAEDEDEPDEDKPCACQKATRIEKSFAARMVRAQLWDTTSALGDALRELYTDGRTPTAGEVSAVLAEFSAWLLSHFPAGAGQAADADALAGPVTGPMQKALTPFGTTTATIPARLDTSGGTMEVGALRATEKPMKGAVICLTDDAMGNQLSGMVNESGAPMKADAADPELREVLRLALLRVAALESATPGRRSEVGDAVTKAEKSKGLRLLG